MKKGAKLIQIDFVLQTVLGVIYLVSGVLGFGFPGVWFIALLAQLALGSVQLFSALLFLFLGHRENNRVKHISAAVVCLTFLGVLVASGFYPTNAAGKIIPLVFVIIIPFTLAIWYYNITINTKNYFAQSNRNEKYAEVEMEDILDSQELG